MGWIVLKNTKNGLVVITHLFLLPLNGAIAVTS